MREHNLQIRTGLILTRLAQHLSQELRRLRQRAAGTAPRPLQVKTHHFVGCLLDRDAEHFPVELLEILSGGEDTTALNREQRDLLHHLECPRPPRAERRGDEGLEDKTRRWLKRVLVDLLLLFLTNRPRGFPTLVLLAGKWVILYDIGDKHM